MATLTYNPSDPDAPEFTEEEQDSIKVGEALEAQGQQLLAGKYKDAESLEKAYIELQTKLGERNNEVSDGPEDSSEKNEEEEQPDEQEPQQDDGQDEGNDEEEVRTFSDEDVTNIKNIAGGEAGYNELIDWAKESITPKEIEMFNNIIDRADAEAAYFAVHALRYAMHNAVGYEGKLLQGKAARETKDVFRSQAQVVEAMSDPRYDSDPAYRQDLIEKLERSDVQF